MSYSKDTGMDIRNDTGNGNLAADSIYLGAAGSEVALATSVLNGSATLDPASIAAAATATATITVTGAAVGDYVLVAPGVDLAGLVMTASVTSADTVTVVLYNPTAGGIDLASSTWKAKVIAG